MRPLVEWAEEHIQQAAVDGVTLVEFVFADDFERYLYNKMLSSDVAEYLVVRAKEVGVGTYTELCGIRCRFDKRVPHGRVLFVYHTGATEPFAAPVTQRYPGDELPDSERPSE